MTRALVLIALAGIADAAPAGKLDPPAPATLENTGARRCSRVVYTWMGGSGSSKTWFRHGPLMKDFAHPTTPGATRIADALYDAPVAP